MIERTKWQKIDYSLVNENTRPFDAVPFNGDYVLLREGNRIAQSLSVANERHPKGTWLYATRDEELKFPTEWMPLPEPESQDWLKPHQAIDISLNAKNYPGTQLVVFVSKGRSLSGKLSNGGGNRWKMASYVKEENWVTQGGTIIPYIQVEGGVLIQMEYPVSLEHSIKQIGTNVWD